MLKVMLSRCVTSSACDAIVIINCSRVQGVSLTKHLDRQQFRRHSE